MPRLVHWQDYLQRYRIPALISSSRPMHRDLSARSQWRPCRGQGPSIFVAVSARRPINLKLQCSDPPLPPAPAAPAPAAPAPAAACAAAPTTVTPPKAGKGARRRTAQVAKNLVVLDERCTMVCRIRTACSLQAGFHLLVAVLATEPEKVMTGICKAYDRNMQFGTRKDTLGIYLVYFLRFGISF